MTNDENETPVLTNVVTLKLTAALYHALVAEVEYSCRIVGRGNAPMLWKELIRQGGGVVE